MSLSVHGRKISTVKQERWKKKGIIFYPLGVAYEFIEGPSRGSKYFVYYIPQEDNKTRLVMAADFKLASLDSPIDNEEKDDHHSTVLSAFEKIFNQDCVYT